MLSADGKAERVIKSATDITERERDLESIANGLEEMRDKNLAHRIAVSRPPDIAAPGNASNLTQEQLCSTMEMVKVVSVGVERSAGEVSHAWGELASRKETQAATLIETSFRDIDRIL